MKKNHSLRSSASIAAVLLLLNTAAALADNELRGRAHLDATSDAQCPTRPNQPQAPKLADSSADGEFYVCAGRDGRIAYGRSSDGITLGTFYMCRPEAVALSSDGQFVAVVGKFNGCSSEIRVWNTRDRSVRCEIETDFGGESLLFSADGKFLASITGGSTIELWNLENNVREWVESTPRRITHAAFSTQNGGALIAVCEDGRARQLPVR